MPRAIETIIRAWFPVPDKGTVEEAQARARDAAAQGVALAGGYPVEVAFGNLDGAERIPRATVIIATSLDLARQVARDLNLLPGQFRPVGTARGLDGMDHWTPVFLVDGWEAGRPAMDAHLIRQALIRHIERGGQVSTVVDLDE